MRYWQCLGVTPVDTVVVRDKTLNSMTKGRTGQTPDHDLRTYWVYLVHKRTRIGQTTTYEMCNRFLDLRADGEPLVERHPQEQSGCS